MPKFCYFVRAKAYWCKIARHLEKRMPPHFVEFIDKSLPGRYNAFVTDWSQSLNDSVNKEENEKMEGYRYITLREDASLKNAAASWFHSKWGVPEEAYLACMDAYVNGEAEYGWYLCLAGETIVAGLGVIENDFHDRKDLTPNVCAVYTEKAHRGRGIAGKLLNMAVEDCRQNGISPVYLITDHTGFYERYGWEFLCMVQGNDEPEMSRMYIHR